MKKLTKIKTALSFLLTIAGLQNCKAPDSTTLPREFNLYAELNSKFISDKFEVLLLAESNNYGIPHPIRLFYSVQNRVILEVNQDENSAKQGYHYYKLDENAGILDSLYVPFSAGERTAFIGEYTVHTRSRGNSDYSSWPLDGDSTARKIEILNQDLAWDGQTVNQQTDKITADASYYFYDLMYQQDSDQADWCIKRLFFCLNHNWQVLYQKIPKTSFMSIHDSEGYYRYRENFFLSSNDQIPGSVENFVLKYFDRAEKIKYTHAIGGGSAGFSQKGWVGTGYFDVPLLNDTLKIKKQNLIVEESKPADPTTRYYLSNGKGLPVTPFSQHIFANARLNYVLYSADAYRVYAIRKKADK